MGPKPHSSVAEPGLKPLPWTPGSLLFPCIPGWPDAEGGSDAPAAIAE